MWKVADGWIELRRHVDGKLAAAENAGCCWADPTCDVISTVDELAVNPANQFKNLTAS